MAYILFQKSPNGWVIVGIYPAFEADETAEGDYVCLE